MLWYTNSSVIYRRVAFVIHSNPSKIPKKSPYLNLERIPLRTRQAIRLGDNRHDINHLAQLLHDNHINRAERMSRGAEEVQAAVNTRVLNVSVPHRGKLFAQVRRVLVLDVFDYGIPAEKKKGPHFVNSGRASLGKRKRNGPSLVVDLIAIPGRIDDVQSQPNAILNNH
jgi:hypothetical protein